MIDEQFRDEDTVIWPPPIGLPAHIPLIPMVNNKAHIALASVITAGLGLLCWACCSISLWTLYAINEDNFKLNTLIHNTYDAALVLGGVGFSLGLLGRKVFIGKIGLILSISVMCLLVTSTLLEHKAHGNGQWIWNADYSDCGC